MAVVVPKINTDGKIFEHVTILDPTDFLFFEVPDYATWVSVREAHANVGSLGDIVTQLCGEREALYDPLTESFQSMIHAMKPVWAEAMIPTAVDPYVENLIQYSCWLNWKLGVDPEGTYSLVLGCAWGEFPRLLASDLWNPAFKVVAWDLLWKEA